MSNEKITREKIVKELQEEIERIDKLNELKNQDKEDTEEYYELNRDPLSIDVKKEVTILLSWGGPEDGFKLMFDSENELLSGVYYMADWGQYQEIDLNEDELQAVYDFYLYGDNSFLDKQ